MLFFSPDYIAIDVATELKAEPRLRRHDQLALRRNRHFVEKPE
jgi:hypothetical protein